jgi:hypothetical protein
MVKKKEKPVVEIGPAHATLGRVVAECDECGEYLYSATDSGMAPIHAPEADPHHNHPGFPAPTGEASEASEAKE